MIDRGHLNTAGGYAEGRVLDSLRVFEKRDGEVLWNQMRAAYMKRDLIRDL